ncbi:MAG TPA: SGNH/GDSL hydrolase family protein [Planctomycetota bacterium]
MKNTTTKFLTRARIVFCALLQGTSLFAATITATEGAVLDGLSPFNWVRTGNAISTAVNGASVSLKFQGTRQVALRVATEHMASKVPARFPIIAWSVNGSPPQSRQLAANETSALLCSNIENPAIELYVKGMSPFENRYTGDVPANAIKITGFTVDDGGSVAAATLPSKIWLNIGDSIMSGDGAAYAEKQGRPPNDEWAASEDGRASYGYLLARHYGYRESRIAYGGYNWGGGMAGVPALSTLIDQVTSTQSRLTGNALNPPPQVVLINLGENGAPADKAVIQALEKVRSRVSPQTKIIVVVPVSGRARTEVSRAFNSYKSAAKDESAYLVDLGKVTFATCDGQHPTAAGHQMIFAAAMALLDAVVGKAEKPDGKVAP